MFFRKKNTLNLDLSKSEWNERVKSKLKEIDHANMSLSSAIAETRMINVQISEKLKKQLKRSLKDFTELSEKLKVGVFLVNYTGEIIRINKTALHMLGVNHKEFCDRTSCVECDKVCSNVAISSLISSVRMINSSDSILFDDIFFYNISECVAENLSTGSTLSEIKDRCSSQIGVIKLDNVQDVEVITAKNKKIIGKLTFSIYDNMPDSVDDLTYVIILTR